MEWTILHRFGLAGTNGQQFIKRRNPNVEIRIDDQSQSSKHGFFFIRALSSAAVQRRMMFFSVEPAMVH